MTRHDDGQLASGISEALASYVAEVRMPDHLLDQAAAGYRARIRRNRLIASMSAVAAAAVVAVAEVGTGQAPPPSHPVVSPKAQFKAENAAYLVQRMAAAQVNSYQMISMSRDSSGIMYTDISTHLDRDHGSQPAPRLVRLGRQHQ